MSLRDKFVQDGYLVVEDFISHSVLEKIKLELLQLIKLMFQQEPTALLKDLDFNESSMAAPRNPVEPNKMRLFVFCTCPAPP